MSFSRGLLLVLLALLLVACGRGLRDVADGAPDKVLDPALIQRPQPRPEPLSAYGNHSPYTVLGRSYHVLPSAAGYSERGVASWYGTKFHGRLTSSGEPYDLYQLTAAHRSLPLPTWVEVTRLDTGKTITVRVNDRGPFHSARIIDLSWAAARELGMDHQGTAEVEVRAISFDADVGRLRRPARLPVYLQVGAFAERASARKVEQDLKRAGLGPIEASAARTAAGRLWRVRVGPIREAEQAMTLMDKIIRLGLGQPQYVYP